FDINVADGDCAALGDPAGDKTIVAAGIGREASTEAGDGHGIIADIHARAVSVADNNRVRAIDGQVERCNRRTGSVSAEREPRTTGAIEFEQWRQRRTGSRVSNI